MALPPHAGRMHANNAGFPIGKCHYRSSTLNRTLALFLFLIAALCFSFEWPFTRDAKDARWLFSVFFAWLVYSSAAGPNTCAIYTYMYKSIYIYMLPPSPRTTEVRESATNPPRFKILVYDLDVTLGFEVPRRQHMYIGRSLHSEFLRPFCPNDGP